MDLDNENGRCCRTGRATVRLWRGELRLHDDGSGASDKGPRLDERGDDDGMPRRHLVYARLPFRGLPGFLRPAHSPALPQGDEQQPGADGDFNGEHGDPLRGPWVWRVVGPFEKRWRGLGGQQTE